MQTQQETDNLLLHSSTRATERQTPHRLFWHPGSVMNHGFARVTEAGGLRVLDYPNEANLDALARILTSLSQSGRGGPYGGSIVYSHAFEHSEMASAYTGMFGTCLEKPSIRVMAWKDGGRLREALRNRNIDPPALTRRLDRLRFLSPIRHPIDHAISLPALL
jgi:hypothetical protein